MVRPEIILGFISCAIAFGGCQVQLTVHNFKQQQKKYFFSSNNNRYLFVFFYHKMSILNTITVYLNISPYYISFIIKFLHFIESDRPDILSNVTIYKLLLVPILHRYLPITRPTYWQIHKNNDYREIGNPIFYLLEFIQIIVVTCKSNISDHILLFVLYIYNFRSIYNY